MSSSTPATVPFQSTLPIREETWPFKIARTISVLFQSTLPIREETKACEERGKIFVISIHSSHTGRDATGWALHRILIYFNPLFPYGKRQFELPSDPPPTAFQSTLPIREETCWQARLTLIKRFQSTLPIREETRTANVYNQQEKISIHSSHTGRDLLLRCVLHALYNFNPLFPYGKRPIWKRVDTKPNDFNPLFPYGKRRWWLNNYGARPRFQSTLPIREETKGVLEMGDTVEISIHSSHTGRDRPSGRAAGRTGRISIHSSHTGRDYTSHSYVKCFLFQSTLPIREETLNMLATKQLCLFQSTLPIREETLVIVAIHNLFAISIHSSHTGRDPPTAKK